MSVEWLTPDDDDSPPPTWRPRRRRRALTLLAVLTVVVAGLAVRHVVVSRHHGDVPAAVDFPTDTTPSPVPIPLSELSGHVFVRGTNHLVRIDARDGHVATTRTPEVAVQGGVTVVATPDGVVVRPAQGPGYLVSNDGRRFVPLTGLLASASAVFPSLSPYEVWAQPQAQGTVLPPPELVDVADPAVSRGSLPVPMSLGSPFASDGSGYLLYSGDAGVYDLRPTGVRRVTVGIVLAVGESGWLVDECNDFYVCSAVLIDRLTSDRWVVGAESVHTVAQAGSFSPDGFFAAYVSDDPGAPRSFRVVDLRTGADVDLRMAAPSGVYGSASFAWSTTGHTLVLVDATGAVHVVDPATSTEQRLHVAVQGLTQVAVGP